MTTKQERRFDHWMNEALSHHAQLVTSANGIIRMTRNLRKAAYRFALCMIAIQERHHNEFIDWCRTNKTDPVAWLDDHYAALVEITGQHPRELIEDIKSGMKEADYVKEGRLYGVRRRASVETKAKAPCADVVKAAEQMEPDQLREQLKAAHSTIRELERDLAKALEENRSLHRTIERMMRAAKKVA